MLKQQFEKVGVCLEECILPAMVDTQAEVKKRRINKTLFKCAEQNYGVDTAGCVEHEAYSDAVVNLKMYRAKIKQEKLRDPYRD